MVVVGRYLLVQQVFSFEMGKWECFFFCWGLGVLSETWRCIALSPPNPSKAPRFNDQRSFQWTWTYCGTRWVIQQKTFQLPFFFFLFVFPSLLIGGLGGLVVWYSDWIPKHERDGFLGSTRFESQTTNLPFVFSLLNLSNHQAVGQLVMRMCLSLWWTCRTGAQDSGVVLLILGGRGLPHWM